MKNFLSKKLPSLSNALQTILKGYAGILFCKHPWVGLFVIALSFLQPMMGLAGGISALIVLSLGKLLRLPDVFTLPLVYNSALVGFFLTAYHPFSSALIPAIAGAIMMLVLLVPLLGDYLWRLDHLPSIGLPFVVTTWLVTLFIGPGQGGLIFPWDYNPFPEVIATFLCQIGAIISLPYPIVGFLLFCAIFFTSRILALLAVTGYFTGQLFSFIAPSVGLDPIPQVLGYNHLFLSLALGGIYTAPSISSFLMAQFGVVVAMFFGELLSKILLPIGLAPLALPYGLASLFVVSILRRRSENKSPILVQETSDLPEISHERIRVAQARCPEADSFPLAIPFYGEWQIYQGFDGDHTHQGPWRYSLDFYIHDGKTSFLNTGSLLEDYYCFGKPVLSPVYGFITSCRDDLPDMPPGQADTANNWGNHVVIRTADGSHVVLAHLRQGNLQVYPGMSVVPGTLLASCGSSGRSPQPHLHVHVQKEPGIGSPTRPFHLAGALLRPKGSRRQEFLLQTRPDTGDSVAANQILYGIQDAFYFPVQRAFFYEMKRSDSSKVKITQHKLSIKLNLFGEFRVESDSGANAAFIRTESLFSCFDRNEVPDMFLDIWLLSVGFTPLGPQAKEWRDRPFAKLIPCSRWRKILANTLGITLIGLRSRYRRASWNTQTGVHRHPCSSFLPTLITRAWMSPADGIYRIQARLGDIRWNLQLVFVGSDFIDPCLNVNNSDSRK